MAKSRNMTIRLPDESVEALHEVAKMAGVREETVIKVLLALYVIKHPISEEGLGDERG